MTFSSSNVKKFLFDVSFDNPSTNVKKVNKDKSEAGEEVVADNNLKLQADNKAEQLKPEKKVEIKTPPPPPPPPKEPTFTQKELDEANKTSFALGEAAGIKKNSQSVASLQTKTFEHIVEGLKRIETEQKQNNDEVLKKALLLATEITKKVIPNIAKKYGLEEIETLITKYLPQINKEKIIIKVNSEQKHNIDMKIYELAKSAGFEGIINVVEDKAILAGDCQILWDNGEIEKNSQKIIKNIDEIINQNISEVKNEVSPKA